MRFGSCFDAAHVGANTHANIDDADMLPHVVDPEKRRMRTKHPNNLYIQILFHYEMRTRSLFVGSLPSWRLIQEGRQLGWARGNQPGRTASIQFVRPSILSHHRCRDNFWRPLQMDLAGTPFPLPDRDESNSLLHTMSHGSGNSGQLHPLCRIYPSLRPPWP